MVSSTASSVAEAHRPIGGIALKQRLQQVGRRRQVRALLLVLPLFLCLAVTFVVPIGNLLVKSFYDPDLASLLPQTAPAIEAWDGQDLPPEEVFAAFAADLQAAHKSKNT